MSHATDNGGMAIMALGPINQPTKNTCTHRALSALKLLCSEIENEIIPTIAAHKFKPIHAADPKILEKMEARFVTGTGTSCFINALKSISAKKA